VSQITTENTFYVVSVSNVYDSVGTSEV